MSTDKLVIAPGDGSLVMAHRMAKAMAAAVKYYCDELKKSPSEAENEALDLWENDLTMPPDKVSWWGFGRIFRSDPAKAAELWERIQDEAHHRLESGHRAADVVEHGMSTTPLDRANFLILRQSLIEGLNPRPGPEMVLIDNMAQMQHLYLYWLGVFQGRANSEAMSEESSRKTNPKGAWNPPRLYEAEALQEAADMMERFNRLYLRNLRAFQGLRRFPVVHIENAGQVNIAGQQVNTATPTAPAGE